jgi:uncharacterized membrane protein HdeD (DUF308 family)
MVTQDLDHMGHAIKSALRGHWRLFVFQGVVMITLGLCAIVAPVMATLAVDIFVGWLFLLSGIAGLIAMFSAKDMPAFLWSLVTAALCLAAGILLVWKPTQGAVSLTILLTAFFIVEGLFQTITSVAYREWIGSTWGWLLLSGIADLVLAALIIMGWPTTAAWTVGLLVGVNLITSGWGILMIAFAGRNLVRFVEKSLP